MRQQWSGNHIVADRVESRRHSFACTDITLNKFARPVVTANTSPVRSKRCSEIAPGLPIKQFLDKRILSLLRRSVLKTPLPHAGGPWLFADS
jgi:hypothetical protein